MFEKDAKIWQLIADECSSPGEFIGIAMVIRKENDSSLAQKLGVAQPYVNMIRNNKLSLGAKACLKYCNALNINPVLLNRINADYIMKKLIDKENGNT